jgi:NAD(P)H-dependent FMN reductase
MMCASEGANLQLSHSLAELAASLGIPCEVLNLVSCDLPLYSAAAEASGVPDAVLSLAEKVRGASGFVFVAPEYNGSLPPVLNNAIAWVSRSGDDWREAFAKKFAALATHSGGGGHKVLASMRQQLEHLGCNCLARQLLTTYQEALKPSSAEAVLGELWELCSEKNSIQVN